MTIQLLTLQQASIELYGPSATKEEENEKYIKLLCLIDKGLKTQRVFEVTQGGKQLRRVKINKADLAAFKDKKE